MARKTYGIKAIKPGIVGLNEAIAKLEAVPEVIRAGLKAGLLRVANEIKGQARRWAMTIDPKLAQSIETEVTERDGKVLARVFVSPGAFDPVQMPVFIEMGTGPQGIASADGPHGPKYPLPSSAYTQEPWYWYDDTGQHTKDGKPGLVWSDGMEANPYLWPAFLKVQPYARDWIIEEINRKIRQLKAGGGGKA